jgi:spore coat polysaccharide biosynthesis predicted glycosyltransferase SpsG
MMRVLFRPDLSPSIGAGHAMRDLALAEELVARGHDVEFACSTAGLAWVEQAIVSRGCSIGAPGDSLVALARERDADIVVVDSYTLPKTEYLALLEAGIPLVSIVDHKREDAIGDLVVNPGPALPGDDHGAARRVLAGLQYALVRREFRAGREQGAEGSPLRVLVTFGGTDAFGASAMTAGRLLRLGLPLDLSVVTRHDLVAEIESFPLADGQSLTILSPGAGFVDLALSHDVVVSAAGSTSLELLALGAAVGLVCVADNQERYYDALATAGAAVPVATLEQLREGDATTDSALRELLGSAALRAELRAAATRAVDGLGPVRVVDAMLSGLGPSRP